MGPLHAFAVHGRPFAPEEPVQPPVAPARLPDGERLEAGFERGVVAGRVVALRGPGEPGEPAGTTPTPERRSSPRGPRPAAVSRSPLFSPQILEDLEIERLVGDHALQAPVLVLQRAQALGLVDLEDSVFPPPLVERLAQDPVAPDVKNHPDLRG